jgi:hypothetical protein
LKNRRNTVQLHLSLKEEFTFHTIHSFGPSRWDQIASNLQSLIVASIPLPQKLLEAFSLPLLDIDPPLLRIDGVIPAVFHTLDAVGVIVLLQFNNGGGT